MSDNEQKRRVKINPVYKKMIATFSFILRYFSLVIILIATIAAYIINPFYEFEMAYGDKFYTKSSKIPDKIKIIAVDAKTMDMLGPYSKWNRSYFANLLNCIHDENNQPAVVGVDFVFVGTDYGDDDIALHEAIANLNNVILATNIEFDSDSITFHDNYYYYKDIISESLPFTELRDVCDYGFTNMVLDKDGYVRNAYSKISFAGEEHESFAYKIAKTYKGQDFELGENGIFQFEYAADKGDFDIVSMSDVLNGSVGPEYFKNSIVLIGAYEEGLMDSYFASVSHGHKLYAVEIEANIINSMLEDKQVYPVRIWMQVSNCCLLLILFTLLSKNMKKVRSIILLLLGITIGYTAIIYGVYAIWGYYTYLIYFYLSFIVLFFNTLGERYVRLQYRRSIELQKMMYSMADSMSVAIEGRTPYNAHHTQNVSRLCVELLEKLNAKNKGNKAAYHYNLKDLKCMYLAGMLHDIGKMDVPIEIMDKESKLGTNYEKLILRLKMIDAKLERDACKNAENAAYIADRRGLISNFVDELPRYNSGAPLSDRDFEDIQHFSECVYKDNEEEIPYLTEEELEALNISYGTLTAEERRIMQGHVTHTGKILNSIYFSEEFESVRAVAENHHELLDGSGYTKGLKGDELDVYTRILTIMDIYDSLIADDRPYKKAKTKAEAVAILEDMADKGKVDKALLDEAKDILLREDDD